MEFILNENQVFNRNSSSNLAIAFNKYQQLFMYAFIFPK